LFSLHSLYIIFLFCLSSFHIEKATALLSSLNVKELRKTEKKRKSVVSKAIVDVVLKRKRNKK
jgi:hypothetical protein